MAAVIARVRRAASGPCPRCGTVWVAPRLPRWRRLLWVGSAYRAGGER